MSSHLHLARVDILFQQQKFAAAEQLLRDLLATEPNNPDLLSLLAEAHLQQDQTEKAEAVINHAIGLSPADPDLLFVRSRVAVQKEDFKTAESVISQAVALNPYEASYFALWAAIQLPRKQFERALELADQALAIDPENLLALNTRSTALLKLNRAGESALTIEGALREDPNNAYTHANYGWNLLEKGDHKKALEHFRESLKNDPFSEFARDGMAEALKASNPVYRLFLRYSFWIGNLTAKYQAAFLLGFYFGVRLLRGVANSFPALQPFLLPLIFLLSLIAFSTWIITPISNLFLRFNRYGQVLLSSNEKRSANLVAASLGLAAVGLICYLLLHDDRFLPIIGFGVLMMIPLGTMLSPAKNKWLLPGYTAVMALVGLAGITETFDSGELINVYAAIFLGMLVIFQWVANFMLIRENNR